RATPGWRHRPEPAWRSTCRRRKPQPPPPRLPSALSRGRRLARREGEAIDFRVPPYQVGLLGRLQIMHRRALWDAGGHVGERASELVGAAEGALVEKHALARYDEHQRRRLDDRDLSRRRLVGKDGGAAAEEDDVIGIERPSPREGEAHRVEG